MKQPERMSRIIVLRLLLVGVLSILCTAIGTALIFQNIYAHHADEVLTSVGRVVAAGYQCDDTPNVETLSQLAPDNTFRITLIGADGTVYFDSYSSRALAENHSDRPEVQQALAQGEGRATRQSATVGYETHYYATRLQDGSVLRIAQETTNIWFTYNSILPMLAGGILILIAGALALSVLLTRSLVRPINKMAQNLDVIESVVPYTELVPLAHTIQSDRELRENSETMRRDFTANVSHELKTPLTSISGYAELLENGMVKPEDVPGFGARIHSEASRMIALVSDILQLSELDGMHQIRSQAVAMSPMDLAPLVKEVAGQLQMNASKAFVTLQYTAEPAIVNGNRDMLMELTTNLCDNAVRYNRPGGHVMLRCGTGADGIPYLLVEDNGIGIPRDAQNRVFERFFRVDKSRSKATGGTGLGLAIVKHISMLHKAQLDLRSQVGTGTTIRVSFPKCNTAV